jgi:hypothetical protein
MNWQQHRTRGHSISTTTSLLSQPRNWIATHIFPEIEMTHRYMIERTFPAGALDGVDAAVKQKVNANNQTLGVKWELSYANAQKTKTFCVYTGPSEAAVREAATRNGLPVDSVTEIPSTLYPQ